MNLRDLEYFYQLSLIKSYTGVAQHFNISQPTVSYAVKRLEEELGCDLVIKDNSHRSVVLTTQGDIFAHHIETVLLHVRLGINEVKQSLEPKPTVGFPPIIMNYIMDDLIRHDKEGNLLSKISTIRGGSRTLLLRLLNKKLDFSFIGSLEPLRHDDLAIKLLFKKPFYFVVAKNHPLAGKEELSFQDVLTEKFILLDENNTHFTAFETLNRRYQNKAKVFFKIDDVALIKQMVAENFGISLLSDIALGNSEEDLVKIPLVAKDKMDFYISYVYQKGAVLSRTLQQLLEVVEKIS